MSNSFYLRHGLCQGSALITWTSHCKLKPQIMSATLPGSTVSWTKASCSQLTSRCGCSPFVAAFSAGPGPGQQLLSCLWRQDYIGKKPGACTTSLSLAGQCAVNLALLPTSVYNSRGCNVCVSRQAGLPAGCAVIRWTDSQACKSRLALCLRTGVPCLLWHWGGCLLPHLSSWGT